MTEEGRKKLMNTCDKVLTTNGASVSDPKFYQEVERVLYDIIDLENEIKRLNDLLKAQQPRVLSYKEVMESDFVFIELYTDEKDGVEPEFIRAIPLFISYSQPYFVTQYDICGHGTQQEYMCNWRCWTAIPTDEQRKAVPWKDGER